MIQVALASNSLYFPGMMGTIVSIVLSSQAKKSITFHILDGGIADTSWRNLEVILTRYNKNAVLKRYRLEDDIFRGLKLDYGKSYMAYSRILLSSIVSEDSIIYVDSDILFLRDIDELWNLELNDYILWASQDPIIKYLCNDCPWMSYDDASGIKYFNSGLMKINLKLWREYDIEGKTLTLIKSDPDSCQWWDQTALNYILKDNVKYIDSDWNRSPNDEFQLGDFENKRINIHYLSPLKPWLYYSESLSYKIWRCFFRLKVANIYKYCINKEYVRSYLRFKIDEILMKYNFLKRLYIIYLNYKRNLFLDGPEKTLVTKIINHLETVKIDKSIIADLRKKKERDKELFNYITKYWSESGWS